jgi:hypothetical protein
MALGTRMELLKLYIKYFSVSKVLTFYLYWIVLPIGPVRIVPFFVQCCCRRKPELYYDFTRCIKKDKPSLACYRALYITFIHLLFSYEKI